MTKIALITGGSRGIGKAIAIRFARNGISSIITYNSSKDEACNVVEEISKMGVKCVAVKLNAVDRESYMNFAPIIAKVLEKEFSTEKFDILINNAGFGLDKSILEITEAEFDNLTEVHFRSVFFLSQKLVPLINKKGQIIMISSGLTRLTFPGYSVYASLKGAIETLTKFMAKELAALQIRVNCVAPGATVTDFCNGFAQSEQVQSHLASTNTQGRVGMPMDIANVIALIASDDGVWMNAQRFEASGGQAI